MNRIIAIAPVALLSAACAVRTPATALDAQGSEFLPPTREVALPSDGEAIGAWQLPPESPWSRYEKLTLFGYLADREVQANMPEVGSLDMVRRAQLAATRLATHLGVPPDTMWVVDLRGAASVAFGATLSRLAARPVAPVLTFNNWPAEHEVVPAEQTLAALVTMRPRPLAPAPADATPVFLLDAYRLAFRDTPPDLDAIDNRYMLLASDFPDPAILLARGIRRVIYVVEDRERATTEEDDFHEVARAYQDAGLKLALVDLDQLGGLEETPPEEVDERWAACFDDWAFRVEDRVTIFDDPRFYTRARGGFGGARAFAPAPPGVGWGTHGGSSGGRAYSGASPSAAGSGG